MSLVPVIRRVGVQPDHRSQMQISPQSPAPSLGALFIERLLQGLAVILGFPVPQPVPVRARR